MQSFIRIAHLMRLVNMKLCVRACACMCLCTCPCVCEQYHTVPYDLGFFSLSFHLGCVTAVTGDSERCLGRVNVFSPLGDTQTHTHACTRVRTHTHTLTERNTYQLWLLSSSTNFNRLSISLLLLNEMFLNFTPYTCAACCLHVPVLSCISC